MATLPVNTVVNGPAVVRIKFPQQAALVLGVCVTDGGCVMQPQVDYNPISSDVAGTRPADMQITGIGQVILMRMAYVNKEALDTLFKFSAREPGTMTAYGKPLLANNQMFELGIEGPLDQPWHFYGVTLQPNQFNVGTIHTVQQLTFVANPPIGNQSTANGVKLYDRTALS